jgi:hypothetical protein
LWAYGIRKVATFPKESCRYRGTEGTELQSSSVLHGKTIIARNIGIVNAHSPFSSSPNPSRWNLGAKTYGHRALEQFFQHSTTLGVDEVKLLLTERRHEMDPSLTVAC